MFVDPGDVERLAVQVQGLFDDKERLNEMKRLGGQYIRSEFCWELVSRPFADAIAGLLPAETRLVKGEPVSESPR